MTTPASTPTPTSAPTPASTFTWPRSRVVTIVRAAAVRYDLDVDRFLSMIRCESGFNPRAVGGGGLYLGLGQQHRDYWPARAARAGWKGYSPFNARANANTSAWMVAHGGGYQHWPHCGYL